MSEELRALVVFVVYQSEFQHQTLDDRFSAQYTMRPSGSRTREPVAVDGLTACLNELLATDGAAFDELTSHTNDVVHLEHAELVARHHRGPLDFLLVGSSSNSPDTDTQQLAELLGTVLRRQLRGQVVHRTLGVNFDELISTVDTKVQSQRKTLKDVLEEMSDARPFALYWDRCYASVKGPAAPWLDAVLSIVLPTAIPIQRVERPGPNEPITRSLHSRADVRNRDMVRDFASTGARAQQRDMVHVVAHLIEEARQLVAAGTYSTGDREDLSKMVNGEFRHG